MPGIRQYHNHPQHSVDSWLLHRETHEGSLATICDRIWRAMARNLLGVNIQVQTLPGQIQIQTRLVNAPGEVAPALWEQAKQVEQAARAAQSGVVPAQALPPEVLAALGVVAAQPPPEETP